MADIFVSYTRADQDILRRTNVTIGSSTIGSQLVGGGGEETAHPFDVTFPIHTARFQHVSVRFEAQRIGHAAISYTYKDIRDKGTRSLPVKTV